jgi:hypothetical protein
MPGGTVIGRCRSGRGNVESHHRVASELAARQRLLCHHLSEQRRVAAKGTLESGAQTGTPHGLGGVSRRLADVVGNKQAPPRRPSAGLLVTLVCAAWRCGPSGHLGR